MRTDELIIALARGAGVAPRPAGWRNLGLPLAAGTAVALALAVGLLGAVPARDFATAAPWMKVAYTGALALALGVAAFRAGLPAASTRQPLVAAAAVCGLMAATGAVAWWAAATPQGRAAAVLGADGSWVGCAPKVALLALPAFAAAVLALRRLAPTRLRAAGALCGGAAGACGALAYAFSCPEASAAYVALWYSAGIALCALAGALAGPRLLRW
ncbi:MAG: hypothetical protein RI988_2413 [Pseudomonadota bacterium]|jgi:hypothetical protein